MSALHELLATLARPLTDPGSRTWWPGLVLAAAVGLALSRRGLARTPEVKSAFSVGKEIAGNALIDSFLLTNIHPQIFPCLKEKIESQEFEALGILETHTCASCIVALDCALKTSKVRAIKLELAKGIGGKAYFVIEGEVGEIESAMLSASRVISKQNIIEKIVIPQAAHSLKKIFE